MIPYRHLCFAVVFVLLWSTGALAWDHAAQAVLDYQWFDQSSAYAPELIGPGVATSEDLTSDPSWEWRVRQYPFNPGAPNVCSVPVDVYHITSVLNPWKRYMFFYHPIQNYWTAFIPAPDTLPHTGGCPFAGMPFGC